MDVGPGDWVICIDDSPAATTGERVLILNRIYTVRSVCEGVGPRGERATCFLLYEPETVGYDESGEEGVWQASRFRPIRKPPIDALKRLLDAPADLRELEGV